MNPRIQKRTKLDVRPVVATGGEVGGDEPPVTFYAYRDEWDGSYVPEEDRTPVSWSDQQLAENTERVRRSGPAARAYENDRRARLTPWSGWGALCRRKRPHPQAARAASSLPGTHGQPGSQHQRTKGVDPQPLQPDRRPQTRRSIPCPTSRSASTST